MCTEHIYMYCTRAWCIVFLRLLWARFSFSFIERNALATCIKWEWSYDWNSNAVRESGEKATALGGFVLECCNCDRKLHAEKLLPKRNVSPTKREQATLWRWGKHTHTHRRTHHQTQGIALFYAIKFICSNATKKKYNAKRKKRECEKRQIVKCRIVKWISGPPKRFRRQPATETQRKNLYLFSDTKMGNKNSKLFHGKLSHQEQKREREGERKVPNDTFQVSSFTSCRLMGRERKPKFSLYAMARRCVNRADVRAFMDYLVGWRTIVWHIHRADGRLAQ